MGGCPRPPETLLGLLAAGALTAVGSWQWRAYLKYEHYQNEGQSLIPIEKWETFVAIKSECDNSLFEECYDPYVNMERLGFGKTEKYHWDWRQQQFSFAMSDEHWPDKTEEWFSASDIHILPPICPTKVFPEPPPHSVSVGNRGGRPQIYEWEKAIAALVFKWADKGDWQPASKADVQRELGDWFAAQGATPSDSLLKQRARWLFQEFESRKLAGQ